MLMLLKTYGVTVIVIIVLALLVFLAIRKIVKDKKAGKSSCGCSCNGCPNAKYCHKNTGKAD